MTPICLWRRCSTDMDIVLASRNRKKIRELDGLLKSLCPDITVRSLDDIGFSGDIEENGQSFAENALIKASVPASLGYIGVADDSGLCVDALCGAPGIYSARNSGLGDTENNKKLLRELSGAEDRGAEFVCAVACVVPTSLGLCLPEGLCDKKYSDFASARCGASAEAFVTVGRCRGEILTEERGTDGFGYDPLFWCPEYEKSFAQLSAEEKDSVSHRGRAMRSFAKLISEIH